MLQNCFFSSKLHQKITFCFELVTHSLFLSMYIQVYFLSPFMLVCLLINYCNFNCILSLVYSVIIVSEEKQTYV